MAIRTSSAVWHGTLKDGNGTLTVGDGKWEAPYSFASRFEEGEGTNPEELIGAAQAGCYSQAFSLELEKAGYTPDSIRTTAVVHLDKAGEGFKITRVDLSVSGEVPGIGEDTFKDIARQAKVSCPVSQALAGAEITLKAELPVPTP